MTRSKKRFYTIDLQDVEDYAALCQSLPMTRFTWTRDWVTGNVMFDKCNGRELAAALQSAIDVGETSWSEILGLRKVELTEEQRRMDSEERRIAGYYDDT